MRCAKPRGFLGKNISGSLGYVEKAPGRSVVRAASHPRGPPSSQRGESLPTARGQGTSSAAPVANADDLKPEKF
jgi:hypothetical protein